MPVYPEIGQAFQSMDQGIRAFSPQPQTLSGSLQGSSTGSADLDAQIRARLNQGDVNGAIALLGQRTPAPVTPAATGTPPGAGPGAPIGGQPTSTAVGTGSGALSLANVQGLEPGFQGNLSNLLSAYTKQNPDVQWRVISGYRSPEQQAGLSGYHAAPGDSAHQLGAAVDLVPVVNGQALSGADAASYRSGLGALAPNYGVYWGGAWRRPDTPHFQAYPGFQQRNDWIDRHQDFLTKQGYSYS
jgi:hypothetical protein